MWESRPHFFCLSSSCCSRFFSSAFFLLFRSSIIPRYAEMLGCRSCTMNREITRRRNTTSSLPGRFGIAAIISFCCEELNSPILVRESVLMIRMIVSLSLVAVIAQIPTLPSSSFGTCVCCCYMLAMATIATAF